jgi:hypothetical protein
MRQIRIVFASRRAHTSRVRRSHRMRPRFDVLERVTLLSGTPLVLALSTGNVVVTTETTPPSASVYDGQTGALISTLTAASGTTQFTVTALTNGNFVLTGNGGTATWGSGTTGVSGIVNAANSLMAFGSTPSVTPLPNGNYVVDFAGWENFTGAVTWGNGTTGTVGNVSSANSLVGSTPGDDVGSGGVTALPNGNYVVDSTIWNNDQGAVTWASGARGISGTISIANSLVGWGESNAEISVTPLANGNFVVSNPQWNSSRGIATWGSGTAGITGEVSAAGSLVGTNVGDGVGDQVVALANGNFVVAANGACSATWGNGTTAITGTVSTANSLLGGDLDGGSGNVQVTALTSGNYVVAFPNWEGPAGQSIALGAVTWANGSTGTTGSPSAANSLVGSKPGDQVGSGGVTALSNGNYVVTSPHWNDDEGAATWGNGSTGTSGTVSAANSLVGSNQSQASEEGDWVGNGGVITLANGNYLVLSYLWDHYIGAVTWGNGALGTDGVVSAANSLVGTYPTQAGGGYSVTALSNGNYLVDVPSWENNAGAVTFGDGMTGVSGTISAANSLVGNDGGDETSSESQVAALANGNYVVVSTLTLDTAGSSTPQPGAAVTWCDGTTGTVGTVPTSNTFSDIPPPPPLPAGAAALSGVVVLPNSDYVLWVEWTGAPNLPPNTDTWFNGSNGHTVDGQNTPDAQNTIHTEAASVVEPWSSTGASFLVYPDIASTGSGQLALSGLGTQATSPTSSPSPTTTPTSTTTPSPTQTPAPSPTTTPVPTPTVIISEKPDLQRKLNDKRKPTGKQVLTGFTLTFGVSLSPTVADNPANYQLDDFATKKIKNKKETVLEPIKKFTVSYVAASDAVDVTLNATAKLATGGQLTVLGGLTTAAGDSLTGPAVFTISKGGKSIGPI